MNTANFLSMVSSSGAQGKYPLSTQTLSFMQDQVLAVAKLSLIAGHNYIITDATASREGVVVIAGEIMPLSNKPTRNSSHKFLCVRETSEDVTIGTETYAKARTYRVAYYSVSPWSNESYPLSSVPMLQSMQAMSATLSTHATSISDLTRYMDEISQSQRASIPVVEANAMTKPGVGYVMVDPTVVGASSSGKVAGILTTWQIDDVLATTSGHLNVPDPYIYYGIYQEYRSASGSISYRGGAAHGPSGNVQWGPWVRAVEPPKSHILGTITHIGDRNGAKVKGTGMFRGVGSAGTRGTDWVTITYNSIDAEKIALAVFSLTPVSLGTQTFSFNIRPEPDYRRITVTFSGVNGQTFEPSFHLMAIDPTV